MKRDDQARSEANDLLKLLGLTSLDSGSIAVPDHGHVSFSADGQTAFVEAVIEVEMPAAVE